jgi:hypothetical protein
VMKVLEPRWATPAETVRCIWPRREQVPGCATTRGLRKGRKQACRRGKLDAAPLKVCVRPTHLDRDERRQ